MSLGPLKPVSISSSLIRHTTSFTHTVQAIGVRVLGLSLGVLRERDGRVRNGCDLGTVHPAVAGRHPKQGLCSAPAQVKTMRQDRPPILYDIAELQVRSAGFKTALTDTV